MAEEKAVFEKYYGMSEGEMSQERKELTKNKIQRQFEVSYDDAFSRKLQIENSLRNMCKDDFEGFDFNSYRMGKDSLETYDKVMKEIESLHVEFFGTGLRNKR